MRTEAGSQQRTHIVHTAVFTRLGQPPPAHACSSHGPRPPTLPVGAVTPRVSQSPAGGLPSTGHVGQSRCHHPDLTWQGAAPLPLR